MVLVEDRSEPSVAPGIGTEFLALREKIENMRHDSTCETLSGADEASASPLHARFFAAIPGECLKPETRCRREWDSNPRATSAAAGFQVRYCP
jgi:hypothetical protein